MKQFASFYSSILFSIICTFLSLSAFALEETSGSFLSNDSSPQSSSFFSEEPDFLPVDEAFAWKVEQKNQHVIIRWHIQDGYYLYHDRFNFELADATTNIKLGSPTYSKKGKLKDDAAFGMVEVYYKDIEVTIPLITNGTWDSPISLSVGYQGCADAGLCYQPQKRLIELLPQTSANSNTSPPAPATTSTPAPAPSGGITGLIEQSSLWISLGTLFLLGIGLAFTPCVLPMVPILSSIIVGQKDISTRKAFLLSLTYVLGMAFTYSFAGVLVGYFGAKASLQIYLQEPAVLISIAMLFVILSLSMFGFYELQLPAALRDRLDRLNRKQAGGNYFSVALMGILSALVVSSCVSAPLIGVLTYISSTGDALLGGLSLLSLSLGMGLPLLIIGTGGGKFLPQAGGWMNTIKAVFGVLLLAVAVWLLERILPGPVTLMLWAALLIPSGIFMGALEKTDTGWPRLWKGIGVLFLIYGTVLIIGAASGESDPLRPLQTMSNQSIHNVNSASDSSAKKQTNHLEFISVNTLDELNQAMVKAKNQNQTTMLDFYADWCISCKIFERDTFSDPAVQAALSNTVLLQADLSDLTTEHQAMLDNFGLFGLPSILFFKTNSEEIQSARVQGEMNAEHFLSHIQEKVLSGE